MIDKFYIDSAIRIRKEYLELSKPLDFYLEQLSNMSKIFDGAISDLEKFKTTLNGKTKEAAEKELHDRLLSVEEKTNSIQKLAEPINKKMENLKKEEEALWEQIKLRYPDVDEDVLIQEIQKHL